jgi:fumarate reductase flavoprotein subunit
MRKINQYAVGRLIITSIGLLLSGTLLLGCAPAQIIGGTVDQAKLVDGFYEGSYRGGPNKASVRVEIKDNRILNFEIVKLQSWGWKDEKLRLLILERIIATQSTRVDAVSGATNSSHVIMNAVQKAIERAYQ